MLQRAISSFNELLPAFRGYYTKVKGWDWKVIGICFFTSFTFWLFNALNDEHNYDLQIPLFFDFDKDKIVVIDAPPRTVTVNVSGNGWNLFKRSVGADVQTEVVAFESVNAAVSNNFVTTRSLLPKISSKLKELQVNYILQDSIFFDFDTLTSKEIQLKMDTNQIPLKQGFRLTNSVNLTPNTIIVEGASSILNNIDDTILVGIDEGEIDEDFDENISLDYLSSEYLSLINEEVNVQFSVAEFENRSMNVGLELVNFPNGTDVTVDPGTAVISYLIEKDEQYLPRDSLKMILDYRDLNISDSTVKPTLIVPPYFLEYTYTPQKFSVSVE